MTADTDRFIGSGAPSYGEIQRAEYERLLQENELAAQRAARRGEGLLTAGIAQVRLEVFIQTVLGPITEPERLAYEIAFQRAMADKFTAAEANAMKNRLLVPGG